MPSVFLSSLMLGMPIAFSFIFVGSFIKSSYILLSPSLIPLIIFKALHNFLELFVLDIFRFVSQLLLLGMTMQPFVGLKHLGSSAKLDLIRSLYVKVTFGIFCLLIVFIY